MTGTHSSDSSKVWRALIIVGGVLLLLGGAALVVGLVADRLIFVWVSIPPMTLAFLLLLIVGVAGNMASKGRSSKTGRPGDSVR